MIIPAPLLDVWPDEEVTALLDSSNRPAFSRYVSGGDREKLIHWDSIEQIRRGDVLKVLQSKHLPKPETWSRLLKLWAYIAPEITPYFSNVDKLSLRVVPVQGRDVLYAPSEVVRLGEKKLLQSEKDWEFLAGHLLALNQNWPRFLAEQRRVGDEMKGEATKKEVEAAFAVLKAIGFDDTSDVSKVLERVAAEFFGGESLKLADCVQLAQIAAKLSATIGSAFRFATQDLQLRATENVVLYDKDGTLQGLFPEKWCSAHLLHPDYYRAFASCTSEEWNRWVSSERAGLLGFVPLARKHSGMWGRPNIEDESATARISRSRLLPICDRQLLDPGLGFRTGPLAPLGDNCRPRPPPLEQSLSSACSHNPRASWSDAKSARALQVATTGSTQTITNEQVTPTWILRLRELPCLPDTRGFLHKPEELLLRTPETEPFMDAEPFVHGRLDHE